MMQLADLRREYSQTGIRKNELASCPFEQFQAWFTQAEQAELVDPTAMVIGTVDDQGHPEQRIVLLKGCDTNGLVFYTNYNSDKGRQLAANPIASILFPWNALNRQIRIVGKVEKTSYEQSVNYIQSRPRGSQLAALASNQSAPVESREALDAQMSAVEAQCEGIDPPVPDNWGGFCLKPQRWEFWQGREARLHDRIIYQPSADGWEKSRLQP